VITDDRSPRAILLLWSPLALQWLMMALEGPYLAAVIARLADPTFNLAAYGVAYAFAILVESPIIMLMSASTALVDGPESYRRLRNFAVGLNALATALLLLVLIPPVYGQLMDRVLGLPPDVSALVNGALWILLPWPAAIGYRRFLHGVMIRAGKTRRIAYGTGMRLAAMTVTALALSAFSIPGAWVGAGALTMGVVVEAIATRAMAADSVRAVLRGGSADAASGPGPSAPPVTAIGSGAIGALRKRPEPAPAIPSAPGYGEIARFYYPLALTSFIALSTQPILTFFMGRAPSPVESLAVFPVVHSLSFLFSALGLSFQEAAIALLGRRCEHARPLARFSLGLAAAASGGLGLVVFTPLASFWFETVSGLPAELAAIATTPARILFPLPALAVFLAFQRAILVQSRTTRPITAATALEVVIIASLFPLFGWRLGMTGVSAAMLSFMCGRTAGVIFLASLTIRTLRTPPP
jgi:progressive ankylosis protein